MNTEDVTRIEVVDESGRVYTRHNVIVELSVQDDGRTLKVFIHSRPDFPLGDATNVPVSPQSHPTLMEPH